ncbi:hypothetical protein EJ08DRAFT_694495 [Tothia fuscella]|uniref:Uncharacterized protein n=1 Tax=Tothia fuscella TaxID=1048955 RepID=A0A9P4U1B2_9PEZI|nr:hypothetical protein EJ08DRAFT_694495 [Tothia fuscella]
MFSSRSSSIPITHVSMHGMICLSGKVTELKSRCQINIVQPALSVPANNPPTAKPAECITAQKIIIHLDTLLGTLGSIRADLNLPTTVSVLYRMGPEGVALFYGYINRIKVDVDSLDYYIKAHSEGKTSHARRWDNLRRDICSHIRMLDLFLREVSRTVQ